MATISRPTLGPKKLSWQDMSTSSPRVHITRRVLQLQNDKVAAEILEGARQFCSEYVNLKLEREGLQTLTYSCQQSCGVSRRIQEVGLLLEVCYPRLYTDISCHINTTLTSKNEVNEVFIGVSSEILSEGINWARIVALYAFAGALTIECYKKDKKDFVAEIDNWMFEFAALNLVDWIKRKGGWEDLLRVFPDSEITPLLPCQRGCWKYVTIVSESIKSLLCSATDVYKAYMRWYREQSAR